MAEMFAENPQKGWVFINKYLLWKISGLLFLILHQTQQ